MKKSDFLFAVIFSLVVCALTFGGAEQNPVVAVMDLETGQGVSANLSAPLTLVIINELSSGGAYQVMDRGKRDEILKAKGFNIGACKGADCNIQAGKLLGVNRLATSRIDKIGASYLLIIQMAQIPEGVVEVSAQESVTDESALVAAVVSATKKISSANRIAIQPVPQQTPTAPPDFSGKCPDDMAYIPEGNICIDKYEFPNRKGAKPKSYMSFNEARDFCKKEGKRLPTEAEFEAACVGYGKFQFGYGDKYQKGVCNVAGGFKSKEMPAGSMEKCANDLGVVDMIGNMWEWTTGGSNGIPVLKGGSYMGTAPSYINCGERLVPQEQQGSGWGRGYDYGFRCAKDAP